MSVGATTSNTKEVSVILVVIIIEEQDAITIIMEHGTANVLPNKMCWSYVVMRFWYVAAKWEVTLSLDHPLEDLMSLYKSF